MNLFSVQFKSAKHVGVVLLLIFLHIHVSRKSTAISSDMDIDKMANI